MNSNGFEQWGGYMEAKITKLEEQYSAASNPYRQSNLFAGISIFVNGMTNPTADELKRIMMVHGGTYHHYERSHTNFIIASNLPDVKVRNMNTSNIISPQWVVDCVREQRILDYTRYLLYTNQKTTQPSLKFMCRKKEETVALPTTLDNGSIPEQPDTKAVPSELHANSPDHLRHKLAPSSSSNVARTAVDPKFLSEFYNNSRLHHIATLGAGFKQYVTELRERHDGKGFPARAALKVRLVPQNLEEVIAPTACVMHIDMDCFFVSVGLRTHPELRGQPVAVTHSKGGTNAGDVPVQPGADRQAEMEMFAKRFEQHLHNNILSDKVRGGFDSKMSLSEIASCSYEARAKGIHNGMFVGHALKLCPDLKTIPYDFEGYREVAYTLYDTIAQYTLNIEAVSCDEMFVDLSDVLTDLKIAPMDFVRAMREEVRAKTGCPCSAGVGANKLQARMATKRAKPDGQYHLLATDVQAYMLDIPIEELPGVGSSTAYLLKEVNLKTCGDLQKVTMVKIQMHVGRKLGETLYKFCRGIDDRPLTYEKLRKSVSAEVNYGIRFTEFAELETFLRQLCTEVHTRLNDIKRRTKCVTLKLMVRSKDAPLEAAKFMGHGVCDHVTKSVSLSAFTCDLDVITRTVLTTIKALALPPNELRGIGITLSKLDDPNEGKERKENVIKNMFNKALQKRKVSNTETISEDCFSNNNNVPINEVVKKSPKKDSTKLVPDRNQTNSAPNILTMLQNAVAKKQSNDMENNVEQHLPPGVDPEVFAALPPDIRAEILKEHVAAQLVPPTTAPPQQSAVSINGLNESDLQPSTSKAALQKLQENSHKMQDMIEQSNIPDAEFLAALPADLRAEVELQMAQQSAQKKLDATLAKTQISMDNIFMQPTCIHLLLNWVKSDEAPESYDVELVGQHACELVRADDLDRLYGPLIYLCRLINQQRGTVEYCAWHAAYREIIEDIQFEMQDFYDGKKLYLSEQLKCDKCKVPDI